MADPPFKRGHRGRRIPPWDDIRALDAYDGIRMLNSRNSGAWHRGLGTVGSDDARSWLEGT